jgi:hypothetical protein
LSLQGVKEYLSETFYGTLDYCWKYQTWLAGEAWPSSMWYVRMESKRQFSMSVLDKEKKKEAGREKKRYRHSEIQVFYEPNSTKNKMIIFI